MTQDAAAADEVVPANALGVRSFRYLWLNNITFAMVMNAIRFVYGWVVLDGLGKGESAQGLVVFLLGIPTLVLVLPAGVWADRLDRRRMLLGTQLTAAAGLLITAGFLSQGRLSMGLMVVSAVAIGSVMAVGSPVRSSLIPELLPPSLLYGGIALNALAMTGSMVLGAVIAQLVGDAFGFDGVFVYLGGLLIVGAVAVQRIQAPPPRSREGRRAVTMRAAVGEGLRFVAAEPALRTLFGMLALAGGVMNALMFVTIQAFVKEDLGRDAGDAAPIYALIGVGLAVSSFVVMRKGNMERKGTVFMRSMVVGSALMASMGQVNAYWQLAVLAVLMGLTGGFFINMNQGLIQANTPRELMGRVMSLYTFVQNALTPIGGLLLGLLASQIGPGNTMTLVAPIGFLFVLFVYLTADDLKRLS